VTYPTPDGYQLFLNAGNMDSVNKQYIKDAVPFWNEHSIIPACPERYQA
jgi:hypothetical protein